MLDEAGASEGSTFVKENGQLLVARPQALYFYTVEGRGACFAFNEHHHHLSWIGQNLAVVRMFFAYCTRQAIYINNC